MGISGIRSKQLHALYGVSQARWVKILITHLVVGLCLPQLDIPLEKQSLQRWFFGTELLRAPPSCAANLRRPSTKLLIFFTFFTIKINESIMLVLCNKL